MTIIFPEDPVLIELPSVPPLPLTSLSPTEEEISLPELMIERANTYWGDPPLYNEAYKKIRWPGAKRDLERKPLWVSDINKDLLLKRGNRWNSLGRSYGKVNTFRSLRRDLIHCISQNIPFKTKSIEYRPSDGSIIILGVAIIKYNFTSGYIYSFTYGGVYNKVITLFLRKYFELDIKLINRKLRFKNIEVDITHTYRINVLINPALAVILTQGTL